MSLEFGNSSNWNLIYSASKVAEDTSTTIQQRFRAIDPFSVPFLLDTPIVAVFASSETNPGYWRFAGNIFQKVQTGITVGGTPDSYLKQERIWLDEITIRSFATQPQTYELEFRVPYWLREITVQVFAYTGPLA